MKRIILFGLLLLLLPVVIASTEQEAAIYTNLVGMGIEEAVVIIQGDDVIIDYVVPEMEYDSDLILQMQGMFVLAAHYVPESIVTVIKVRYDSDPIIIAAVPTEFTQMLRKGLIDPETFWGMVELNPQESSFKSWLWILLFLIFLGYLAYKYKFSKHTHIKKHIPQYNTKQNTHHTLKHTSKHKNNIHKTSLKLKIIALIINLFLPGIGYFIFKQKKAIWLTILTLISIVLGFNIFYFIIWWYSLIDVSIMIWKKK